MKHKYLVIFSFILLIAIVSIACNAIMPTVSALQFAPDSLPAAQMGVSYENEIRVTQNTTPVGEFSISKGSLPAGLALVRVKEADAVKISGTPEEAGTFTFTIHVWCYGTNVSGQVGEKEYSIVVK